jgi:Flp pilus assembly protein TadB
VEGDVVMVDATALLAGVCAVVAVLASAAGVAFARGWQPGSSRPARPATRGQRTLAALPAAWRRRYRNLVALAAGVGLLVWVVTGWPVHGLLAAAVVAGLPFTLLPDGDNKAHIARLEGLADWLQQIAGVHVVGLSLEQTIRTSAKSAPETVREPVQQLAARLENGWPAESAYAHLGHELGDGMADHAVLLLQSHARHRGAELSNALQWLALSVSEQVADLREVEAERARTRTSARLISLFMIAFITVLLINRDYTAPYGTVQGQALLMLFGGGFAFLLFRLHRMVRPVPQPRLMSGTEGTEAEREVA